MDVTTVVVVYGNATTPYVEIARETFHTEFAASLFGWLTCEADGWLYWVLE